MASDSATWMLPAHRSKPLLCEDCGERPAKWQQNAAWLCGRCRQRWLRLERKQKGKSFGERRH